MKYRATIKQICRHCKPAKRGKWRFIRCPYDKSHNQRQGWPRKVPNSQYSTFSPEGPKVPPIVEYPWKSYIPNFSSIMWRYLEQSALNPWGKFNP